MFMLAILSLVVDFILFIFFFLLKGLKKLPNSQAMMKAVLNDTKDIDKK